MSNEEIILRVSDTSYGQVRVTPSVIGHVQVMGGIPGEQGPPGHDALADDALLGMHILDPTPHPPYDDQPSLTLLFENGLV